MPYSLNITRIKSADKEATCGFTLIELSIVLVIIGLVIGGIMFGQTLIKSAEIRAQVSDIEKLRAAINTFRLKYSCLPGDCAQATQLFGGASQPELVTNGDGDGKIGVGTTANYPTAGNMSAQWGYSNGSNYAEWTGVFDHLAAAGLWSIKQYDERVYPTTYPDVVCPSIRFKSYGAPSAIISGVVPGCMTVGYVPGYLYIPDGHKIAIGAYGGTGQLQSGYSAGINSWEAYAIDVKIDDGGPFTGRAYVSMTNSIYTTGWGCSDVTGLLYLNETNQRGGATPYLRSCALNIGADF